MKAIVFTQTGGPEVLALGDVPKPDVRPGMALIKVHAIGVNFADTRFRQGTYVVKPKLPDTPGMDAGARVFGTVSSDAKVPLVREHGFVVNVTATTEKFADEVLRLTEGRG